jgi:hypothetical protein
MTAGVGQTPARLMVFGNKPGDMLAVEFVFESLRPFREAMGTVEEVVEVEWCEPWWYP